MLFVSNGFFDLRFRYDGMCMKTDMMAWSLNDTGCLQWWRKINLLLLVWVLLLLLLLLMWSSELLLWLIPRVRAFIEFDFWICDNAKWWLDIKLLLASAISVIFKCFWQMLSSSNFCTCTLCLCLIFEFNGTETWWWCVWCVIFKCFWQMLSSSNFCTCTLCLCLIFEFNGNERWCCLFRMVSLIWDSDMTVCAWRLTWWREV